MRFTGAFLIALMCVLAVLAASCDEQEDVQQVPAPTSTVAATPAESVPVGLTARTWPLGKRIGHGGADALVEAVYSGDAGQLQALLKLAQVACANETRYDGPSNVPPCGQMPVGTLVNAFPISTCEGGSWQPGTFPLVDSILMRKPGLFAAFIQRPVTPAPPSLPSGGLVVLMRNTVTGLGDGGLAFELDAGKVVRITFPCGPFPSALLVGVAGSDFLLAPPGGLRSLTPTPTPAPRLTGNAGTDRFIRLAVDGDYRNLAAAFIFFGEPCEVNPQGVGSKPRCPDGVPDGGTVQGARVTACERGYLQTAAQIDKLLRPYFAFPQELYAVFQTDGALYQDYVPTGATAIVLSDPKREVGRVMYLDREGGLVGIRLGCGESPAQMTIDVALSAFRISPPR